MTGPRRWPATVGPASTSEDVNGPGVLPAGAVRFAPAMPRIALESVLASLGCYTGSRLANIPRPPAHESGRLPPGGPRGIPPALVDRSPTLTLERRGPYVDSAGDRRPSIYL